MSLATEITRITDLRNTIRTKLVNLGIITDSNANLSACSTAINNLSKVTPTTPSTTISITATPSVDTSTGVITVSTNATQSVSPTISPGYADGSVTEGTITVQVTGSTSIAVYDGTIS